MCFSRHCSFLTCPNSDQLPGELCLAMCLTRVGILQGSSALLSSHFSPLTQNVLVVLWTLVFIVLDCCRTWSGQEMLTVTCNLKSQKSAPSMVMWSRYVSFAPLSLLVLAAPKCHLLTSDSTEHFILEPTSGSSFALPHHLTLWLSDSPGSSGGRGHPNLHWVFKNRVGNKRWGDFLL